MGHCPCFGLLNRKKLKREISNKEQSSCANTESKTGSGSKVSANSSHELSTPTKTTKSHNTAPTFTYEELAIATDNFADDSFLGRGGFGAVYKGKLADTDQVVAVKQLDLSGIQGEKEFLVEVLMLTLMHHPNLVSMIGFCSEGEQRLLVYEYMPLGSLEDHLFDVTPDKEPLDWNTRMKIAAGTANGLDYLHNSKPPVIYRDLKASNILLDEGFYPKLSDFGLAKFGPIGEQSHVSTRVMGTYGYCAPEYASTGRLTLKTDIYSFGVVLLELVTGIRAVDEIEGRRMHLIHWALPLMRDRGNYLKLADPLLRGQFSLSVLNKAIDVASTCLNENANLRPSSNELVSAMDYLVSVKYEPKEAKNKVDMPWPEIVFSPSVAAVILEKDLDRDRAVAEAKMWGESWREKKRQNADNSSTSSTRFQPIA